MALQITLVKTPTKVSVSKTSQTFHKQGGTLGRGESNAWVLPDPDKFLSSCHCEVLFDANKYYILDLSTNGTFYNNSPEPLGKGAKSPLADGDVFEVGEYRFAVKLVADQEFAGASPFAAQKTSGDIFAGAAQSGSASAGFGQPFVGGGFLPSDYDAGIDSQGIDPIALWDAVQKPAKTSGGKAFDAGPAMTGPMFDPVTGAMVSHKPYSGPATDHTPSVDQAISWPATAPENLIPENWDDIDLMSSPAVGPASVKPRREPLSPFDDPQSPFGETLPPFDGPLQEWGDDLDLLSSPPVQPFAKPAASPPPGKTPPQAIGGHSGQGFADTLPPESFAPGATLTAPPRAAQPAPPRPKTPEAEPVARAVQPPSQGAPNNRLMAAMGLDSQRLSAEQMDEISNMVGELMRETVSGMMQVLRSRTSIKNEFRMNVTTIQPVENNPLKFSVTVEDALENMFIKKSNAYKKPVDALREGFQEIGEHQVAMIAGIRQGFDKMMQRFDPENLEQIFNRQGKGSLIPGMQKTRYWTSYAEHYASFVDNMESSFQHLFGADFVSAYEDQLRKLAAARNKK